MSRPVSFVLIAATTVLLSWCFITQAGYRVSSASGRYLAELDARGWIENINNWTSSVERLDGALSSNPLDVDLLMQTARMHQWRAYDQRLTPKFARKSHQRAIEYLRTACRRRPSWGLAWATLAAVKIATGENDQEMIFAVEKAMALGPWELQVQHKVAVIGIQAWPHLPGETRKRVSKMVGRALADAKLSSIVIEAAVAHNWHAFLQPLLKDNEKLLKLFNSIDARYRTRR